MATNYPNALDSWTDKTDNVDVYMAADINNLQDAVEAIEAALGTSIAGTATSLKARLANSISNGGYLNFKSATTLTISSGSITVTQNWHIIDTEGSSASDDLDTINGGEDGFVLFVRSANSSRNVVIRHNIGNILCVGSANLTLDNSNDLAIMIYSGALSKWLAMSTVSAAQTSAANTWAQNQYFSAGMRCRYHSISSNTTITNDYYMVNVNASSGAVTITLPTAVNIAGQVFVVRKSDSSSNAVIIDGNGSETINGNATVSLTVQYTSYMIMSDGAGWMIIG